MKTIILGVVGSRRRNELEDYDKVLEAVLEVHFAHDEDLKIVSGGCKLGADSFCQRIKNATGIDFYEHRPKLPTYYEALDGQQKRWAYAKAAYARNKLIAADSNILIACVAEDRTGGTENTIEWFRKLHKGTRKLILV